MNLGRKFFWIPRILAISYILFLAIFALDVFGGGYGFWMTIWALLIHLTPNFVLVMLLLISWRKEKLGGALFVLIAILFTVFFNTYRNVWSLLLISGIPALIGGLFLLDCFFFKKSARRRK